MSSFTEEPDATQQPRATSPSLRERAKQLAPAIAARAPQVEDRRHVADETIRELIDAGITRGLQAKQWGGEEGTPEDYFGAVVEVGKVCASTAWVMSILGAHTWEVAHMSKELNDELFAEDPTTLISSSYSPIRNQTKAVPGGVRLSGEWRSSSGIHHAGWVILGADITTKFGTFAHNLVVPKKALKIIDDWYTLGLAGTGSRSIIAEDLFVPAHRIIDREVLLAKAGPGLKDNTSPLYQVPQAVLYTAIAGAPMLGAGWGFYHEFISQARKYKLRDDHTRRKSDRSLIEAPLVVQRIAQARAILNESERRVLGWQREAYERTVDENPLTPQELTTGVFDVARAAQSSLDVASLLMPSLSASVVYKHNPLQRIYRDILTGRQHGTQNVEIAGASMTNTELGTPSTSLFVLSDERMAAARERAENTTF